ncbi:hypothetical protein Scep_019728 [Stephania cephalantha]|uniref:Uncharacterized protein n=1 Tax=Stephania cephalantha TaxID=152367 RepID=A0AAP0NN83_9MAGN
MMTSKDRGSNGGRGSSAAPKKLAPARSDDAGERRSGAAAARGGNGGMAARDERRGATTRWRIAGPIDPRRDTTIVELRSRFLDPSASRGKGILGDFI